MRNTLVAVAVGLCWAGRGWADEGSEALLLPLAKADLIVAAELAFPPDGFRDATGVINWGCRFRTVERLAGSPDVGNRSRALETEATSKAELPTRVALICVEGSPASHVLGTAQAGARLILFLSPRPTGTVPAWGECDRWLSAWQYSEVLASLIRRAVAHDARAGESLGAPWFWHVISGWAPAPTAALRKQVQAELGNPDMRTAIEKVRIHAPRAEWESAVAEFEKQRAIGLLQLLLTHPSEDVQRVALQALGRLKDRAAVPFLLIYAEYVASARAHVGEELARTLGTITGVAYEPGPAPKPGEPDAFRKAIAKWQRWQAEQVEQNK